jgi:hypothetical protein
VRNYFKAMPLIASLARETITADASERLVCKASTFPHCSKSAGADKGLMGASSDLRARQSGAISAVREPLGKAAQVQRVQYAIPAYAPLARHRHAPTHEVELGDGMSVGIDAEHAAQLQTALMPSRQSRSSRHGLALISTATP